MSSPGVLITPHVAGDSEPAECRVYELIGEQVDRYLRGELLLNLMKHPG